MAKEKESKSKKFEVKLSVLFLVPLIWFFALFFLFQPISETFLLISADNFKERNAEFSNHIKQNKNNVAEKKANNPTQNEPVKLDKVDTKIEKQKIPQQNNEQKTNNINNTTKDIKNDVIDNINSKVGQTIKNKIKEDLTQKAKAESFLNEIF